MKKLLEEFKQFAMKGNVVDLAVGIIIGGAFGKIVSSIVADVIMPPIGVIIGGVDFSKLQIVLKAAEEKHPEVALRYGTFLQSVFDFVIIAAAVFLMIKAMNRLRRKEDQKQAASPAMQSKEVQLLSEIRDILKDKR